MLRVDLGRLSREGALLLEARVPPDDGLWQDSDLAWAADVDVRLTASFAGTGEVVVRGRVEGVLDLECRRCLEPVPFAFADEVTMVFTSAHDEEDDGTYRFEPEGAELDLGAALREEVILAMNPFVVCDAGCKGLCQRCGSNLNEGACECTEEETDPRWEALRVLKKE